MAESVGILLLLVAVSHLGVVEQQPAPGQLQVLELRLVGRLVPGLELLTGRPQLGPAGQVDLVARRHLLVVL